MRDFTKYEVGEFQLGSSVLVTDPCYDVGTWCTAQLSNVLQGTWVGHVLKSNEGAWGERCAELIALHKDHTADVLSWCLTSADIGVDSGQAGFFDASKFRSANDERNGSCDFENPKTFYDKCGQATLSKASCGIIEDCGIVSSSGYGDGGYNLYLAHNEDGQVIGMRVVFIADEEEDSDEEE